MEQYGNTRGMNKNRFKLVKINEDFTPLLGHIKRYIEESKVDRVICLN